MTASSDSFATSSDGRSSDFLGDPPPDPRSQNLSGSELAIGLIKDLNSKDLPIVDPNEVVWDGNDRENMRNVSTQRKWFICISLTTASLALTALSSAWGEANDAIVEHFGVGEEVGRLGLSLFLLGLAFGPLFGAPLSEFYGRRPIYCGSLIAFLGFQFMTAFSNSISTALIGRFLTSMGGSVFLSNVPGTFADLFERHQLALPMTVFTLGPFLGPGLGPVIAGFIVQHAGSPPRKPDDLLAGPSDLDAGFRWVFYVFLIWSFVITLIILFLVPETYPPILLKMKARRLRREKGKTKEDLYAAFERRETSLLQNIRLASTRPVVLLFTDLVLLILCIYTGFLLSVIYLFFVAFPLVFTEVYQFETQFVGLSFSAISIGMTLGAFTYPFWNQLHQKSVAKNNGIVEPEFRLPQMTVGAVISPIGLFMFAWTIYRSVHWMVPIVASGIFGFGLYLTFNGIMTYTVEAYRPYAASATAANVFVRCVIGCTSPLFGVQMLDALGFHWALSLLGFISVLLCPSAFVFRIYGKQLRQKSKYALK
jgi:MFS family permease